MVEVRKRDRENIGSLLRRFQERIRKSGDLSRVKDTQYYQSAPSRRQRRTATLESQKIRAKKEKLRKLGRLK